MPDKYDSIVALLEELREYTREHFKHEEEYMQSIGYKKMFSQVVEHNQFLEKIDAVDLEHMDMNQTDVLMALLNFLVEWLTKHILEKDLLIMQA
jgi:hemerythrin